MSNQTITIATSDEARPDASQTGCGSPATPGGVLEQYVGGRRGVPAPVWLDGWSALGAWAAGKAYRGVRRARRRGVRARITPRMVRARYS